MKNKKENKLSDKFSREEKIERDKMFLMGTGVCFFMTLIFVLWIFNLSSFWKNQAREQENKEGNAFLEDLLNIKTLGKEIGQDMNEIKEKLTDIQKQQEEVEKNKIDQEEIEILKEKLEEKN
ncbi:hypothetical protein K8R62_03355 [bacterium]|nr:hypothetical protein [bacterium]